MEEVIDYVEITKIAAKKLKIDLPVISEDCAYKMGYDCEMNGANLENCHFTIFSSQANKRAWENGREQAKREKEKSAKEKILRKENPNGHKDR